MFTNEDIEFFLVESRRQKEAVLEEIRKIPSSSDKNALRNAILEYDFYAEDFDRYDSAVCEEFLQIMLKLGIAKEK